MEPRRKVTIAIAVFVIISTVLIVVAVALKVGDSVFGPKAERSWIDEGIYVDPDSGRTIISKDGQKVEQASQEKLIFGISDLLNTGLTSTQVDLVRIHLEDYMTTTKVGPDSIDQISLIVSSLKQTIGKSVKTITADIRINKTVTQKMKIRYVGLTDALLTIHNKSTGQELYISESDDQD